MSRLGRGLGLSFAQKMWGHSNELLDVMLSVSEMQEGVGFSKSLDKSLRVITDALADWGLGSKEEFKKNIIATCTCHDILRQCDGYEAWDKRGQTAEDLREVFYAEYQNLLKLGLHQDANLEQAKNFVVLLNGWSMGEVSAEQRRQQQERHPLRRYAR